MKFIADCPHCQATYKASTEYVGKKGKCQKCGKTFVVEAPVEAPVEVVMPKPMQIEQTSKQTKLIRLAGIFFLLLATVTAAVTADEYGASDSGLLIAGVFAGIGVVTYSVGQMISWWNHG